MRKEQAILLLFCTASNINAVAASDDETFIKVTDIGLVQSAEYENVVWVIMTMTAIRTC